MCSKAESYWKGSISLKCSDEVTNSFIKLLLDVTVYCTWAFYDGRVVYKNQQMYHVKELWIKGDAGKSW